MANGSDPGSFLTQQLTASGPRFGAVFKGMGKGVVGGLGWGASLGAAGGIPGALIGAGLGAGLGGIVGTLRGASAAVAETFERLEKVSRTLIDRFRDFAPAIAQMHRQWEQLQRQLDRTWAQTISPLLKMTSDYAREMKKREAEMKVTEYQTREPIKVMWENMKQFFGDKLMDMREVSSRGFNRIYKGITDLLSEIPGVKALMKPPTTKPIGMPELLKTAWSLPGAEGALTAAMKIIPFAPRGLQEVLPGTGPPEKGMEQFKMRGPAWYKIEEEQWPKKSMSRSDIEQHREIRRRWLPLHETMKSFAEEEITEEQVEKERKEQGVGKYESPADRSLRMLDREYVRPPETMRETARAALLEEQRHQRELYRRSRAFGVPTRQIAEELFRRKTVEEKHREEETLIERRERRSREESSSTETREKKESEEVRRIREERPVSEEFPKEEAPVSVNVQVSVADSIELLSAFERTWEKIVAELNSWEAENSYLAFQLQKLGSYA